MQEWRVWELPLSEVGTLGTINRLKLSEHFSLWEFECRGGYCCGYVAKIEPEVIDWLEKLRARLAQEVGHETRLTVTSGYRCPKHNLEVGGKTHSMDPRDPKNSFHCLGMAADVASSGVGKNLIARLALEIGVPRVGLYWREREGGNRYLVLHLDIADPEARGLDRKFGDGW